MASSSKIRFFFISLTLLFIPLSCENKNNNVIPDVYVQFECRIYSDIIFWDLQNYSSFVYVNYLTNNWGRYSAGYDSSGIIVYRSVDDFYAYDRTCPHDYEINHKTVRINADFTQAVCPACSTVYSLAAGGQPISGPGRYPLKNYKTSFDGSTVRVWNYY
jgi:nitrite reductase/ring-hydroxylating ferredoxin subunit